MPDKDSILDRDPAADEGVAGDLAVRPNRGTLLDFNEGANLCGFADTAAVKIHQIWVVYEYPRS